MERTDDERAIAAPLTVTVGGRPVELRVLSRKESREWQKHVSRLTGDLVRADDDGESLLERGGLIGVTGELREAVVLAYDVDSVLGQDTIDRMSDRELREAYDAILEESNPKGDATLETVMLMFGAARSALPSSTNGRSADGASGRKSSTHTRTGRSG